MPIDSEKSFGSKKEAGGYSHSEKHSIVYTWKIDEIIQFFNSAKSSKEDVVLKSPKFTTGSKIKDLWFLQIEIRKSNEPSKNKSLLSLFLFPDHRDQKVWTRYMFFVVNNKKEKIGKDFKVYDQSSSLWLDKLFDSSDGWGYSDFARIKELLEKKNELLASNDTLTVGVDLTVYETHVTTNNKIKPWKYSGPRLSDDFRDLFVTKKKCDVIIKVGEEKFDAHKLILISRSCVFEAMFSYDMKENKENQVTIPDIIPEIFKKVLDFIYTDKVNDINSSVEELLEAADKYQLQRLKEMCEHSLSKILTDTNAIRIMIPADLHNATQYC
ncbi:Similar to spop-b: Speckle-type POZ protein B (Xenopus laevis) [Cotesia congregata]|uniref:Similar to spop-b: Speckle-type POZ protein B (Xenopus laevis) n=1 Tax=Cotesia congregata TaxID=51543 RepID=A0A8J2H5P2_COTCN|nr:Similar to spop-b: Speckle-type POZ protein B (Xenopus laevis) [Cotesia congregata]